MVAFRFVAVSGQLVGIHFENHVVSGNAVVVVHQVGTTHRKQAPVQTLDLGASFEVNTYFVAGNFGSIDK